MPYLPHNIRESVPLIPGLDPASKNIHVVCAISRLEVGDAGCLV